MYTGSKIDALLKGPWCGRLWYPLCFRSYKLNSNAPMALRFSAFSHSNHDMRIRHDWEPSRAEAEVVPRDFQMVEVAVTSIFTVKPSLQWTPDIKKGCAKIERHSDVGCLTKPFWFFPSSANPGFIIPDGVLDVIDTPNEMDGKEGEELDTQHLASSAVRCITPVFVLPGNAICEPLTTARVV